MKKISLPIRLYIKTALKLDLVIEINTKQTHYLSNVMRKNIGDRISIFNGIDGEFECIIINKTKKIISCRCEKKIRNQKNEKKLFLIFSPIKKERLFFLIEKATELGVTNFHPVITEYTQVKKINLERLFLNSCEASEQTGRLSVPSISPILNLKPFINKWSYRIPIIFCDENDSNSFNNLIFKKDINIPLGILIGPEGGFSDNERVFLNSFQFIHSVSLGERILRSDTAAVSSLSIIQSTIGDWYKQDNN